MVDGPVTVGDLRAEYHPGRALGIGAASPRLSWITTTERDGWMQAGYEIELDGVALGRIDGDDSVFVAWPGAPLASRAAHRVRVRVWGADGSASAWSEPLDLEAGLLSEADWSARWITSSERQADDAPGRPEHFRRVFTLRPRERRHDRARPPVRNLGRHQPVAPERCGGRRHAARAGVVDVRPAPPVRDARRHRERRAGREHDRRGRRRRLVARAPRLGDDAERLRRPARPARATRDHVLRRHHRDDRHRRDVADLVRSRSWAPTSTTASPTTRASPWTAGPPPASTTPHGPPARPSRPGWAGSSLAPDRRCGGPRSCPSAK